MNTSTKTFTDDFKKRVAIEALREKNTLSEIAAKHGITPSLVSDWKEALLVGNLFGEVTRLEGELADKKRTDAATRKELEEVRQKIELLRKKTKR